MQANPTRPASPTPSSARARQAVLEHITETAARDAEFATAERRFDKVADRLCSALRLATGRDVRELRASLDDAFNAANGAALYAVAGMWLDSQGLPAA